MEKWSNVKVVKYRVEGEHNARTSVVHGDYEGKADVIDHITVDEGRGALDLDVYAYDPAVASAAAS